MNIYERIKKKKGLISALAPMEGVTDSVFRQIVSDIGKPDLFFTEFLNVEGFCSEGKENVTHRLKFVQKERPIVVQLWGNIPEYYMQTVRYIKSLKPDGIDINIGCSVKDVLSRDRCSALIRDPSLVKDIVQAVKEETGDIPVSIKTRLGYNQVDLESWIPFLLGLKLDLITMHGRISNESYSTPSSWEDIAKCVVLRDEISPDTLLLGNGDIKTYKQGSEYVKKYHVDGFMVARAVLNNPWFFSEKMREGVSLKERKDILIKHLKLFEKVWGAEKPFNSQKKYIKAYMSNFVGANELRKRLMVVSSTREALTILDNYC